MKEDASEYLEVVTRVVEEAQKYALLPEVIAYALIHMKQNPTISIGEAMYLGLHEWVK